MLMCAMDLQVKVQLLQLKAPLTKFGVNNENVCSTMFSFNKGLYFHGKIWFFIHPNVTNLNFLVFLLGFPFSSDEKGQSL